MFAIWKNGIRLDYNPNGEDLNSGIYTLTENGICSSVKWMGKKQVLQDVYRQALEFALESRTSFRHWEEDHPENGDPVGTYDFYRRLMNFFVCSLGETANVRDELGRLLAL